MNKILFTLVLASLSFTVIQEASAMEENKPLVGITKKKRREEKVKELVDKEKRTKQAIAEYLRRITAQREEEIALNPHIPNPNFAPHRKLSLKNK